MKNYNAESEIQIKLYGVIEEIADHGTMAMLTLSPFKTP